MRHNLPFIATFSSGRGARYTIVESADMRWKVGDDVEPLPRITGLRIGATCNHRRCASVFAPGDCDNSNNSAECGYDGGDCVGVELLTYQQLKIPENGYTFRVSRFDDGRKTPYRIYFWNEALTGSSYRFDGNGDLVYFKAGSEVYYDVFKNDIHEAIEFSRKPESDGGKEARRRLRIPRRRQQGGQSHATFPRGILLQPVLGGPIRRMWRWIGPHRWTTQVLRRRRPVRPRRRRGRLSKDSVREFGQRLHQSDRGV